VAGISLVALVAGAGCVHSLPGRVSSSIHRGPTCAPGAVLPRIVGSVRAADRSDDVAASDGGRTCGWSTYGSKVGSNDYSRTLPSFSALTIEGPVAMRHGLGQGVGAGPRDQPLEHEDRRPMASQKTLGDTPMARRTVAAIGDCPAGFGHTRCECQRCGTHLQAVTTDDILSGACGICGSSELVPVRADAGA
jgi:hypothetical protein